MKPQRIISPPHVEAAKKLHLTFIELRDVSNILPYSLLDYRQHRGRMNHLTVGNG